MNYLAFLDRCLGNGEHVLRHYDRVYIAMDIEDIALQILDIVGYKVVLIALRVFLRGIHITFAIHNFIEFPINHSASCYCSSEGARVAIHKGGGEETSEAPTIDNHTLAIYIRK